MRHRAVLYSVAGLGIVALAIVVILVAFGGGTANAAKQVPPLMKTAGCSYKTVNAYVPPGQGVHVASLTKKLPWNTDPPSNGQHYPLWAVWNFYTAPVNPRMVVHNEEHGGVILWWGPTVSPSTVGQLRAFYDEEPDGSVGTPYAKLGGKIAISAWTGDPTRYGRGGYFGQGHLAICTRFDAATKKAFEEFRKAFRGHGPEGVPLSADKAGTGPPTSGMPPSH